MHNKCKAYRLARALSQEQLAAMSGLSTRTVQRFENGEQASLETLNALAAVFEVSVSELTDKSSCKNETEDESLMIACRQIEIEKRFYHSVITAVIVNIFLYALNRAVSPDGNWSLWVMGLWSALITVRGVKTFMLKRLITKWQKKKNK
ncbi:helix-turn-helix domain-containing protein [Citrobacter portucalensis]|uniref:helix-turn-helix domain-containing protein n=1 Tax=Citrobacter portucalensis TaxID=1639133 RepID=UPI0039FD8F8F